jgi:hypothetical protein
MDILSAKGQRTLPDEQRAKEIFLLAYPKYHYVETPKDRPADIDAFLILDSSIKAVVETKCRYDCDLEKFKRAYSNEWLVTFDKIEKARTIAKSLCVRVVGFLYLKQSDVLLVQEIVNADGLYVPSIRLDATTTQATINGGTATRTNAYINMDNASVMGI